SSRLSSSRPKRSQPLSTRGSTSVCAPCSRSGGSTVACLWRNYTVCCESIGTRHRLRPYLQPHRREKSMKRILVVEDVEFTRDGVVQLLEDPYEALAAGGGVEGFGVAEHIPPDLFLMALPPPFLDGWEAPRRIKANAALCDIPIIALSA